MSYGHILSLKKNVFVWKMFRKNLLISQVTEKKMLLSFPIEWNKQKLFAASRFLSKMCCAYAFDTIY